ncbi:MAG: RHS repeat-associated core domain-containing protein, partial [Rhodocyclaceae bacterium]|nr:RHS repeat-associated core domain-containing protein [Rhodocyclaceae bacterium]
MHRLAASAKLASTQNRFTAGRAAFVSCSQLADASTQNALHYDEGASGGSFDKETNTHYNYFRDYDPNTGRYVQSDPIGLRGGINTYSYVSGNPMRYT